VIVCKSPREIEQMRRANALVADVLAELADMVAPGVTTADLDATAERLVRAAGAEPAFKGYRGYPATLCASVNEEVVHGIPSSNRALAEGDIISLDMGVKLDGFYGDSAVTVAVGHVSEDVQRLLRVTREALQKASPKSVSAAASPTSATRFRSTSKPRASRSCASSWATASARSCTRSRRSRTTASPAAGRAWPKGWSSRSSRW